MSKLFSFGKLISKNKDDALHESESPKITDDQPEETDISDQMENQIANPETSADKDISRYTSDDIIDENNTATRMRRSSLLETMEHDLKIASENLNQQELFLRQSREQLRNFRSFMTSHEVDFETIARLKSDLRTATIEGARLTTINQSLRKQMEAEKASAASLSNRNSELRVALETARAEIIALADRDAQFSEEVKELTGELKTADLKLSEATHMLEELRMENTVLKDRVENDQADLTSISRKATELEKKYEELSAKRSKYLEENERMEIDLRGALTELDHYRSLTAELESQLSNVKLEATAADRRAEEKIKARENELFSLRSKTSTLASELRIKSQLAAQAQDEVADMRSHVKLSRDEVQSLRQRLSAEKARNEEERTLLIKANEENTDITARLDSVVGELEKYRRENERLTKMLKIENQRFDFLNEDGDISASTEEVVSLPKVKETRFPKIKLVKGDKTADADKDDPTADPATSTLPY